MAKFRELIDLEVPVLISFYNAENKTTALSAALNAVAQEMGKRVKVVKMDTAKNRQLTEVLKVRELPALVLYKNGEMVWRNNGYQDVRTLISVIESYE